MNKCVRDLFFFLLASNFLCVICNLYSMESSYFRYADLCRAVIEHRADTWLRENCDKVDVESQGRPLILAVLKGDLIVVSALLDPGIDVNSADQVGHTSLHLAAMNNNVELLKVFIDASANIEAKDGITGATPLHFACAFGSADAARFLLTCHADANAKNDSGNTPLHVAAEKGDSTLVKILLAKDMMDSITESFASAPIEICEIVSEFVLSIANPNIENDAHKKALDLAHDKLEEIWLKCTRPNFQLNSINGPKYHVEILKFAETIQLLETYTASKPC
jgi:ankyrin repeat protein